ncbi:serine threonine protein kinase CMGC group, partial [Linderina pennispora]
MSVLSLVASFFRSSRNNRVDNSAHNDPNKSTRFRTTGGSPTPPQHMNTKSSMADSRTLQTKPTIKSGAHPPQHIAVKSAQNRPLPALPNAKPTKPQQYPGYTLADGMRHVQQKAEPCDDRDGHYIVVPGREFTPRFKIRRLLGQGTFGKVMECEDSQSGRLVAVKVIRAVPKYRDAARIEVRVLQTLQRNDPPNKYQCMHLNETFEHRNH